MILRYFLMKIDQKPSVVIEKMNEKVNYLPI